jgi:hypothetical protein
MNVCLDIPLRSKTNIIFKLSMHMQHSNVLIHVMNEYVMSLCNSGICITCVCAVVSVDSYSKYMLKL